MKAIKITLGLILLLIAAGVGFLYSGLYPMGADDRHWGISYWALETLRERSVKRASENINVPDLGDSDLLLSGGADYNDMCAGCHLQPGVSSTDLSLGLYPAPPDLTASADKHDHAHPFGEHDRDAALRRQFWMIKHGIKASGMPAWGETHTDERIWAMVAFIQKLPELNEMQYQILTAREKSDQGGHR